MTKKEQFIKFVEVLMDEANYESWDEEVLKDWSDALDFWNALKMASDNEKPKFTENGIKILFYMQENKDNYNNLFKAKDIGEGLGITSRTASGALRKLVNDGYVEKVGENPVIYALSSKEVEYEIVAED